MWYDGHMLAEKLNLSHSPEAWEPETTRFEAGILISHLAWGVFFFSEIYKKDLYLDFRIWAIDRPLVWWFE